MPEEPKRTIEPPEWLTQEFIQNTLQTAFKDKSLKISRCFIKPATAAGDNYVSQIFRVNADFSGRCIKENFSFLIKSLPKGEKMEEFVHECQFFQKEAKMLTETLPKIYKYLGEIGYCDKYSAEVYYNQGPPKDLIFLQDLCVEGCRVADRKIGLDLPHCVKFLESLAVLHAGSLALIENEPDVVKNMDEGFYTEKNTEGIRKALEGGIVGLAKEVEKWNDTPKKFADSLASLKNDILKKTVEAFKRRDDKFNVIIHGDTWTNNFMFKYQSGKVSNLKFVDFQLSGYNSPVLDLIYFIFSSPKEEIKLSHIDFFLETYHNKLKEVCGKLKVSNFNYNLKDLKDDFENRIFFAIIVSILVFPITTFTGDAVDLNELLDEETEMDTKMFKAERYKREMKSLLPYFEERGVI